MIKCLLKRILFIKIKKMKKCIVFPLLFLAAGWAYSQDLTVHLPTIKSPGEGRLIFLLFDKADGFPKEHEKAFRKEVITDFSASASVTFAGVPAGQYAVAVMHDKNGNKQIDTNFMGMPKEPVGVSNMDGFGRPSFEKSAFALSESGKTIEVKFMND